MLRKDGSEISQEDPFFRNMIANARAEGKRPTVMVVIATAAGYIGAGPQKNEERNWSLPQGEIEVIDGEEEGVEDALWRELHQELALRREYIVDETFHYLFSHEMPFPVERAQVAFPNGKLYICFATRLKAGRERQLLHNSEMYNWILLPPELARHFCTEHPNIVMHAPRQTKAVHELTRQKGIQVITPAINAAVALFGIQEEQ